MICCQHIKKCLPPDAPFNIVGYSYGGCVALELVRKLEMEDRHGQLWLIDGAPGFLKPLAEKTMKTTYQNDIKTDEMMQFKLLLRFVDTVWDRDQPPPQVSRYFSNSIKIKELNDIFVINIFKFQFLKL